MALNNSLWLYYAENRQEFLSRLQGPDFHPPESRVALGSRCFEADSARPATASAQECLIKDYSQSTIMESNGIWYVMALKWVDYGPYVGIK